MRASPSGKALLLFFALGVLGTAGCSGSVTVDDPGHIWRTHDPLPVSVAVTRFVDGRPVEERDHVHSYLKSYDYTHDKMYDEAVPIAMARATAEQLGMTHVFQECSYLDLDWAEAARRGLLPGTTPAGVDLVLTAKVKHFSGWRELNLLRSLILLPAGLYGTAAGVVLGNDGGGKVELAEVRLVDARTGETVWEGDCKSDFTEKQRLLETASDNASLALREAVNGLAKRVYEGLAGLSVAKPATADAPPGETPPKAEGPSGGKKPDAAPGQAAPPPREPVR
ncbi:MAG: hypothetical protein HYZ53_24800 [Planctomycetes bacterium]|nr:hypothetical protein [Planctomycetota bacterium]